MKESNITTEWKHFIEKKKPLSTECYEIKIVDLSKKVKSFAFNRVADHQVLGLTNSLEGLWLKIPDTAASNGFSSQKPFDAIWIKAYSASVVIVFYQPRKFKKAIKIPISNFIKIRDNWKRKSIRMEELEKQKGIEIYYI